MRRKFHIATNIGNERMPIRIADGTGKVVCTLPHDERRLARLVLRCLNVLGRFSRPYGKHDWWVERNVRA